MKIPLLCCEISGSDGGKYEDEIQRCVVSYKQTDVSEVSTASTIIIIALMMKAVCTSETFVYFDEDHTAPYHRRLSFIVRRKDEETLSV
jgi:hypothetical protein